MSLDVLAWLKRSSLQLRVARDALPKRSLTWGTPDTPALAKRLALPVELVGTASRPAWQLVRLQPFVAVVPVASAVGATHEFDSGIARPSGLAPRGSDSDRVFPSICSLSSLLAGGVK